MGAQEPLCAFDGLIGELRRCGVLDGARELTEVGIALKASGASAVVIEGGEALGNSVRGSGLAPGVAKGREKRSSARFGPHASAGMIMKRDAAFELGGAAEGSCSVVLATADESLVRDGRVMLVGDDMGALSRGVTHSFAQVLLVAGSGLTAEDLEAIEETPRVRDWIAGMQVRSLPGEVFTRVSAAAVDEGLGFSQVGEALGALVRSLCPRVFAVEAIFVTSASEDVKALYSLRESALSISHDLRRARMAAVGIDIDCPGGGHCGACKDKGTCAEVRRIQALRDRARA